MPRFDIFKCESGYAFTAGGNSLDLGYQACIKAFGPVSESFFRSTYGSAEAIKTWRGKPLRPAKITYGEHCFASGWAKTATAE